MEDGDQELRYMLLICLLDEAGRAGNYAEIGEDGFCRRDFMNGVAYDWDADEIFDKLAVLSVSPIGNRLIPDLWARAFPKAVQPAQKTDKELRAALLAYLLDTNANQAEFATIGACDPQDRRDFKAGVAEAWPARQVIDKAENYDIFYPDMRFRLIRALWSRVFAVAESL